jgi:signal transduction histidine kinase
MATRISIFAGLLIATGLIFVSLWAWQQAPHLQLDADRPEIILWAVRTAAVAAAALAQTVILVLVIGNIYRTRAIDVLFRFLTAAVFAVSLVSAIALGLAGR